MKKLMASVLAVLLLLGMTACGTDSDTPSDTTTTTTTTQSTQDSTTTTGSDATTTPSSAPTTSVTAPSNSTTTATTTAPTTAPSGDIIPIGPKPTATTTTTTATKPTTSTATPGGSTTATTTTTTTTTTTVTTTKPTVPAGPSIILPAIGSDIDVTKQKGRIRVSGYEVWYNDDGTIHVELTVKNVSSNWITEETDYLLYSCYDKNGNVLKRDVKLFLGVIDTKKHAIRTYSLDLPANTAELRFTKSKITYWTEWA